MNIISQDNYHRLVGLLTLAADHCRALRAIERSAIALTQDELGGHTSDTVWGGFDRTPDELLALLGIALEQPRGQATFTIAADGRAITCLLCGKTSYNPQDVAQRYCGHCKLFHKDI